KSNVSKPNISITVDLRIKSRVRDEYSVLLWAKRANRPPLIIGAARGSAALFKMERRVITGLAKSASLSRFQAVISTSCEPVSDGRPCRRNCNRVGVEGTTRALRESDDVR